MSTTIDNKVVEMRFDNKQFEQGVATTMSTLDKLKQSLHLKGATKGLEDVGQAAKNVDMNGLGSAVETVKTKFSALQVMGVTALANITNSAVNAGKRMISALTIDPIKTGLSEYETQIGAVQTILANTSSKGSTLQDVNSALDTLNTYADKTIYNFTEMTRNIGTFTAAGVDLKSSVSSIQGIANLAAVSGSTSQQASTAMYQLSQALSSGTVKLMDWNSVVNAGMGGQVFQDALKRTATIMGTNVDKLIEKNGSFRESLQEGWITSEVLTKTLEQFTMAAEEGSTEWNKYKESLKSEGYTEEQAIEILKMANTATDAATKVKTFTQLWDTLKETAQSGWTQTWEIIIGDFEEAKEFLTHISDTIGPMIDAMSKARNDLLSGGLSSGWKQLLGSGIADEAGFIDSIKEVAKTHNVTIDEMIEKEEGFDAALAKALQDGTMSSDMLTESVSKMADKMKNMSDAELEAAGYTVEHVSQIEKLDAGLKDGSISMDEFTTKIMRPSGRENLIEALKNSFDGLMSIIKPIKEAFSEIFPPATSEGLYSLTERIRKLSESFKISDETAIALKNTFKGVFSIIKLGINLATGFAKGVLSLVKAILPVGDGLLATTGSLGEFITGISEAIAKLNIFEKVFSIISGIVSPIANGISKALVGISTGVNELGGIIGIFKAVGDAINWMFDKFTDLFAGISGGEGFKPIIDIFNGLLSGGILIGIKRFIDTLTVLVSFVPEVLEGLSDALEAFTNSIRSKTLKNIAISIGILAASLWLLSTIDSGKMTSSLGAITTLFIELFTSLAIFEKMMGGSEFKSIAKVTRAMIKLSIAVLILAAAMKIISTLSWSDIGKGLIVIAAGLTALVIAVGKLPENDTRKAAATIKKLATSLLILSLALKVMGSMSWGEIGRGLVAMAAGLALMIGALYILPQDMGGKAAGMIALSLALVILGGALKIMGSMSWDEIGRGLVALAGALVAIALAMNFMPKSMIFTGIALVAVAAGLVILAGALKIMGSMSWGEIGKGLTVLAGALIILAVGLTAMIASLPGAAALLVASAALAILTPVLMGLGSMSWGEIAKGLIAIAGAFTILGVAGLVLGGLILPILGLSAALALLGVGIAAIGAGVLMFSTGMTALAVSGVAGAAALTQIVISIITLLPTVATALAQAIITFAAVIAAGAPVIAQAIIAVVMAVIQTLTTCIPPLMECLGVLVTSLLDFLISAIPQFVIAGIQIVTGILQGIADNLGGVIEAGTNIIISFIKGVAQAQVKLIDAAFETMIAFINGLADSIRKNTPAMISAVNNLMDAVIFAVKAWFSNFASRGKDMVTNLISGVKSKFSSFKSAAGDMMQGFIQGIKDKFTSIKNAAVDAVKGAVNSVKSFLGIKSPSRVFSEMGGYSGEGFVVGMEHYAGAVKKAAGELGKSAVTGMQDALGIHSPAKVVKDEVGKYVVEGLAEGIKKDMSAEEAAEQKAKNIVDAFKTEMAKHDTDMTTSDLEYQLWEVQNESASAAEKTAQKAASIYKRVASQTEKVALAQAEYTTTFETFGENSEKTQEAYNKWVQEQIDLNNETKSLLELRNQSIADANEAAETSMTTSDLEYELWESKNPKATDAEKTSKNIDTILDKLPKQAEAVGLAQAKWEAAKEQYGESSIEATTAYNEWLRSRIDFVNLTNSLTETYDTAIGAQKTAQRTYYELLRDNQANFLKDGLTQQQIEEWARKQSGYDPDAMQKYMTVNADDAIANAFSIMASTCTKYAGMTFEGIVAETTGESIKNGVTAGVTTAAPGAEAAVQTVTAACTSAATTSHADWIELGKQFVIKFAEGVTGAIDTASQATITMISSAYQAAIDFINNPENGSIGLTPRISPILDLSRIQNGVGQMNGMFATSTAALADINVRLANDSIAQLSEIADEMRRNNDSNHSELVKGIDNLRGELGSVVTAIDGMHVRLDSRALVGEIIALIDRRLGESAIYKGRGN